jgi:hypothetical protein
MIVCATTASTIVRVGAVLEQHSQLAELVPKRLRAVPEE